MNIEGNEYNLLLLSNKLTNTLIHWEDKIDDMTWDYYHQFNGGIDEATLKAEKPYCDVNLDGVQTVRCSDHYPDQSSGGKCFIVHYKTDFDFKPYNKGHQDGIIYYAEGQPIPGSNPELYSTVDLFYVLKFNKDVEDYFNANDFTDPSHLQITKAGTAIQYWWNITVGVKLVYDKADIPSPTPTFSPNCFFQARSIDPATAAAGFGYDFHLDQLNGGPFGIRNSYVDSQNNNITIFYQPCERMECPWEKHCGDVQYSSIWYCVEDKCTNNGLLSDNELNIDIISEEPTPTAEQTYKTTSEQTTVNTIECALIYPKGHFLFDQSSWKYSNGKLTVHSYSEEICLDKFPEPTPPAPGGKCNYKISQGQYLVTGNIATYNRNPEEGTCWDQAVKVSGASYSDAWLYYQPCGAIECLDDAFCEGDEDASVWVCRYTTPPSVQSKSGKMNVGAGEAIQCRAYGLYANDIDISLSAHQDISNGLLIQYYNFPYTANVFWNCKPDLAPGKLLMPENIEIKNDGKLVSFNVSAEDACAAGPPPWHPPVVTMGPTPSPTPQPSPNPIDFATNGTHYIYTNLDQITQPVYNNEMKLAWPGMRPRTNLSRWNIIFHPWDHQPCPEGYDCQGFDKANIWGCYNNDAGRPVCLCIADRDRGNDMQPFNDELENGAKIIYEGVYGIGAELDVKCNRQLTNKKIIEFDSETYSSWYYQGTGGDRGINVIFSLDSGYTCPYEFKGPRALPPKPTATPVPKKYKNATYFESEFKDGKFSSIDIEKLESQEQDLYIGTPSSLRKMHVVYNPLKKKNCPDGWQCLGGAKSNIWLCDDFITGEHACIPAGDIDVQLDVSLPHDEFLMSGINLEYNGGYNDYTTNILFQCNMSVGNNVVFEPVVENWPPGRIFVARAHTGQVCPRTLSRKSATGGAVFLLILILIFALYFPLMIFIGFIKDSSVQIPNAKFWYEFVDSICSLIVFAFTCGRKVDGGGAAGYDSI